MILTWCKPSNPVNINEHHKESMVEDFLHQQHTWLNNNDLTLMMISLCNLALNSLQDKLLSMRGRELSEYGFPKPRTVENDKFARVYCREIHYNQDMQRDL